MIGDNQPTMSTDAFLTLKRELESYPRLAGYYLIKMIDITDLRGSNRSAEQIAEAAFQQLDDHQWPPADVRPTDQTWSDYIVDRETAARETVAALVGGPGIGHTANTIPPPKAHTFFDRFDLLFDMPKLYYIGMGFGNRDYVYPRGVAIISNTHAGLLCVIESD